MKLDDGNLIHQNYTIYQKCKYFDSTLAKISQGRRDCSRRSLFIVRAEDVIILLHFYQVCQDET